MGTEETGRGHTPGPWVLGEYGSPRGTFFLTAIGGMRLLSSMRCGQQNAALIAAAPELLEALRDAVDDLEQTLRWRGEGWECSEDELLGHYRSVISKATEVSQ
jgi:hypothetical protein